MDIVRLSTLASALAIAATLPACQSHERAPPAPRTVKLETVGAGAPAGAYFTATIRQQQRAELAFDSGGRITALAVDIGDRVRRGQVLARLDAEPARLRLRQAQANLAAAAAQLQERDMQLRQQQAMFDDGAASQAALAGARSAQQSARAQVQVAQSESGLAARALRMTELRAPFDGSVAARLAQPQAEVTPGQPVLQLDGQGQAQALAALPPQVALALKPGDTVHASDSGGGLMALRVRAAAARLEHGATVPVLFDLPSPPATLRSGENILFTLPPAGAAPLSMPLSGLVPAAAGDTAAVFAYQPAQGTVQRRTVRLGAIRGERAEVQAGLQTGEQVVAAGAAFLSDGEKVLPLRPAAQLAGGGKP